MEEYQEVITNISNGNNVILYNRDVHSYYHKIKEIFECVFINEPVPVKVQLLKILNKIVGHKKLKISQATILDIKELIVKHLEKKTLVILFNQFEMMTKSAVQVYEYLNGFDNIIFVTSFKRNFKKEVYFFFKTFIFINREEYKKAKETDEINVTYPLYFILSVICFAVYLKFALSLYSQTISFAVTFIGALWFSFIVFRTFTYIGGKT